MVGRSGKVVVWAAGLLFGAGLIGPGVPPARSAPPAEARTYSIAGTHAVLAPTLAAGESGEDPPSPTGSWYTPSFEYRVGVLPFSTPNPHREWNLGLGKVLEPRAASRSFLGAGLAVDSGAEAGPYGAASPWDRFSVGGWVGGCLSCDFRGRASLDLEMKWAPGSLGFYGDDSGDEGRIGATLRIPW